jgi:phenylacetic acid degradation protein paaN
VKIAREVLNEQGFDRNLVSLLPDTQAAPITRTLVKRPEIKIIDYTGSSAFGEWIEQNAPHAAVFTEKAGVNSAIIDSIDDLKGMANNLAFTLSLYSGQMCTTSQNIFVPRNGVKVAGEHKTFDEVAHAIVDALNGLLGEPKRAAEILGAIQNDQTLQRVDEAALDEGGVVLRPSQPVQNEQFPQARTRSPLIIKLDATQQDQYMREMFGPISFVIATDNTAHSVKLAAAAAKQMGAITWSLYSTDAEVVEDVEAAAIEAGVPLSTNLTGPIYVNQSAAFSDYHVSGANPSGNATLTDSAFVTPRFRVVQSRIVASNTEAKPETVAAAVSP